MCFLLHVQGLEPLTAKSSLAVKGEDEGSDAACFVFFSDVLCALFCVSGTAQTEWAKPKVATGSGCRSAARAQFPYNCILEFRILDDWSNFFLKIVILNDSRRPFQSAS